MWHPVWNAWVRNARGAVAPSRRGMCPPINGCASSRRALSHPLIAGGHLNPKALDLDPLCLLGACNHACATFYRPDRMRGAIETNASMRIGEPLRFAPLFGVLRTTEELIGGSRNLHQHADGTVVIQAICLFFYTIY